MKNTYIKTALLLGGLSVVFGAFGAHYIADRVPINSLNGFKTGVSYQVYHSLLLLIIGFNLHCFNPKRHKLIFTTLLTGICFFSGSLYLLTTRTITQLDFLSFLGPVTPIGGMLLIISWGLLFISLNKVHK